MTDLISPSNQIISQPVTALLFMHCPNTKLNLKRISFGRSLTEEIRND